MTTRAASGQFAPGVSGNPAGRPKREVEQQYIDVTIAVVSPEDWQEVVRMALADAMTGDAKARQWLSDYILGKPTQRSEITGNEGGPISWREFINSVTSEDDDTDDIEDVE